MRVGRSAASGPEIRHKEEEERERAGEGKKGACWSAEGQFDLSGAIDVEMDFNLAQN